MFRVSYPRCQCQIQCHVAFLLFSSKSFIILGLTYRPKDLTYRPKDLTYMSLIHFELIFEYGVR